MWKNCSDKGLNKAIQCDFCAAAWVHASCEGVSSDDYKLLTIYNEIRFTILDICIHQMR